MTEYIKREAAIRALLNDSLEQVGYSREDAADCIFYMDAADVAQVRHGRWIDNCCYNTCSVCEKSVHAWNDDGDLQEFAYCPNCGAMMDLK